MPDLDDTVATGTGGEPDDDTAPVLVRRQTVSQSATQFTVGRALPPQAPPVTDIHLLEFRPPEVPSGSTVRYRARVDLEVTELPDFDATWQGEQRRPRTVDTQALLAHQLDDRRRWRRRAVVTVVVVSVLAVAAGVLGIWALQQL
jgi:hypothetical protein